MKSSAKALCLACAGILGLVLSSCNGKNPEDTQKDTTSKTTQASFVTTLITTVTQAEIKDSEIVYEKFSQEFALSDVDFTGVVDLPSDQHYSIALSIKSNKDIQNTLLIDNEEIANFDVPSTKDFKNIIFENIFLTKGQHTITLKNFDGDFQTDKLVIASSDVIEKLDLTLDRPLLSNKNPSQNAVKLYDFLCESFGSKILSGQYVSDFSDKEINAIYEKTGRHPAIRFSDLMHITLDDLSAENDVNSALAWAENGGIVGFSWHWYAPMGEKSFYTKDTDFKLSNAVTKLSLENLDQKHIDELYQKGFISEECVALLRDMDKVAQMLKSLKAHDVPVLFRPLPEASGGWFWWGCDKDSYRWLWELIYNRFTQYHKLDNIIWVWNAQNPDWYVGDKFCDVISADIYSAVSQIDYTSTFIFMKKISDKKPVALSECDSLTDTENLLINKNMWSFFSFWCGDFLIDQQGNLNEKYVKSHQLLKLYNNSIILTREDLSESYFKTE